MQLNSFNQSFPSKFNAYLEKMLLSISPKLGKGDELGKYTFKPILKDIVYCTEDSNYYVSSGRTAEFVLDFAIQKIDEKGKVVSEQRDDWTKVRIPQMINDLFIIGGKLRVPTNTLGNSSTCRIYEDRLTIDNGIECVYNKVGDLTSGYQVEVHNDENDLSFIGEEELMNKKYKSALKLTELAKKKIQVKLDRDADQVGDYLTYELANDLIGLGLDRYEDSMIDKKIYSIESNVLTVSLDNSKSRSTTARKLIQSYGMYEKINLSSLSLNVYNYFNISSDGTIDIPSIVNPLVYDALKYKIKLDDTTAYNSTMIELIDVANTPENGNVNKLNELNYCVELKDEEIFIKCYEYPSGKKVKVNFIDYTCAKVLENDYWDYKNNHLKDGINKLYYKLRFKEHKVSNLVDVKNLGIKYIQPKPDEMLALDTRRIPFVNQSDNVRISMGSSMSKQACEVGFNEPPLIDSGNYDDTKDNELLVKYSGDPTKVKEVTNEYVLLESGEKIPVPNSFVGMKDVLITFSSPLKVGDKVSEGTTLFQPDMLRDNTYNIGINAKVFFMSYFGKTYEDGVVISENFARKMAHYSAHDVVVHLSKDDTVNRLDGVGSQVGLNFIDELGEINKAIKIKESESFFSVTRKSIAELILTRNGKSAEFKKKLETPNNIETAYIVDIDVKWNKKHKMSDFLNEQNKEIIEDWLESKKKPLEGLKDVPEKYRKLKCNEIDEFKDDDVCCLTFKLIQYNPVRVGDKLANRYGGKGVCSLIVPMDKMPYRILPNGEKEYADCLINPASIVGRINSSQLSECALNRFIEEMYSRCTKLCAAGKYHEAKELTSKYYGDKFVKMTDEEFQAELNKGITSLRIAVGSFSDYTWDRILGMMKDLGVEETDTVYIPGEGKLRTPVVCGYVYYLALSHFASYACRVTGDDLTKRDPILRKGLRRTTGQKVGEINA